MSEPALLSIAFFGTALLFVVLGVPLRRRRVKPNILYGFRTPSTLRDPRIWYEVNATAGADMIGVGVVLALVHLVALLVGASAQLSAGLGVAVLTLGSLFMAVHGLMRSAELAAEQRDGNEPPTPRSS